MEPLKHECGVAMIRLLKPVGVLPGEVWNLDVWLEQAISADGEAA